MNFLSNDDPIADFIVNCKKLDTYFIKLKQSERWKGIWDVKTQMFDLFNDKCAHNLPNMQNVCYKSVLALLLSFDRGFGYHLRVIFDFGGDDDHFCDDK